MLLLRVLAVWLVLMAAEVVHGIARVALLEPRVGDFRARQIAVFTGSAMILLIVLATVRWLRASGTASLLAIGTTWLGLTLAFELVLGRFVFGYSWARLASDYNVVEGGLLPIGLVVLALSPWIAVRIRGLAAGHATRPKRGAE